ncbi:MAG: excinuclease ABC subunit UvrC [Bacteroidota bacterium]|nr:excinuclease ABC subunit UvrC [Bacteroidota bacterium]
MADIKEQIKLLPSNPGIYKYFNKDKEILYIGKAKNLKKRVNSYFVSKKSLSKRIERMISKIYSIEYTIVDTENEALLLENSLIKKYQPKYNVRLKDGKSFPFIAIKNERFPRVFSTRTILKDGTEYFGPFVSGLNKNYLLELLQKLFKIRRCGYNLSEDNISKNKIKKCLDYHIGLCKAPCENLQSESDYNKNIEQIKKILKGKTSNVILYLKEEMTEASKNMDFEKADEIKQTIDALKDYKSKSMVVNPKMSDVDVYAVYSNDDIAIFNFLKVTNGAVIQTDTIEYKKQLEETDAELLQFAITEMRTRFHSNSKEIILPLLPDFKLENIKYVVPKIGDKKKLLELSYKNAFYYFQDIQKRKALQTEKSEREIKLLKQVQKDLDLKYIPYTIECFDNSNIQGSYPVASMSVFKYSKPHKKSYRHYNIKTVIGANDFASMEEVIFRRYKRVLDEKEKLPELIVVDGGKGQLSSAYKSLVKLKIQNKVEIIGIAKKLEEIYKVGDSYPLAIDKRSQTNRLIQQIRNEAHRFGIEHHRTRRLKGSLKTELSEIKGIGKKTATKLLENFKSVKKIKESDVYTLSKFVGSSKANLIKNYFENKTD